MTTAFLQLLQKSTNHHHGYSGCVINITSISGPVRISQGHFSYNASKGAQVRLSKLLATEIAKARLKIRVKNIAPGVFPSETTTQDSKETQKSELPKEHKAGLPAGRPGNDRDTAAAILFAVCCQYLNGHWFLKLIISWIALTLNYRDDSGRWRLFDSGRDVGGAMRVWDTVVCKSIAKIKIKRATHTFSKFTIQIVYLPRLYVLLIK
jgi:hypothetical protein